MKRLIIAFGFIFAIAWSSAMYWDWVSNRKLPDSPETSNYIAVSGTGTNTTGLPLVLPTGFSTEIFAGSLPGARVLVQDGRGNFWVSQPSLGQVSLLEIENGLVRATYPVLMNLKRPHGLAVDPKDPLILYIAEEDRISKVRLYTESPPEVVIDMPETGRHWTRTIEFGPDDRLYVSIGSTCDTCEEKNPLHAAIHSLERDGSDFRTEATGLRNSVFFTWSYVDSRMWATDMGRDHLGDDLPPEEVNIIENGKHYGWPWCYGQKIHDIVFDARKTHTDFCTATTAPAVELPAHTAPLGIAFIPEEGWPEEYWYDVLVAMHGSWNSSTPVGYKIVRVPLDAEGNLEGPIQDFVSGWIQGREVLGRPVDILVQPGGTMYVTDDKKGVVYRVFINGVQ